MHMITRSPVSSTQMLFHTTRIAGAGQCRAAASGSGSRRRIVQPTGTMIRPKANATRQPQSELLRLRTAPSTTPTVRRQDRIPWLADASSCKCRAARGEHSSSTAVEGRPLRRAPGPGPAGRQQNPARNSDGAYDGVTRTPRVPTPSGRSSTSGPPAPARSPWRRSAARPGVA